MPRIAMRLLHPRHDPRRCATLATQPKTDPRGHCSWHRGQSLPLHWLLSYHRRHRVCRAQDAAEWRAKSLTPSSPMIASKVKGYMGQPMKRVEDPRLIKGIATYVDDL